jgi:hypothetical protein
MIASQEFLGNHCILPAASGANNRGLAAEFGVRSKTNVFVDKNKQVHVTVGELKTRVVPRMSFLGR